MKINIAVGQCVSSGNCTMLAPELFDQSDEDGSVVVLNTHPSAEEFQSARQAAESCPALAIELEE